VVAHEAGVAGRIATERVVVAADKPNAQVMALNPLSKIPTLVLDDGTSLYDSRVIAEYLDTLHGGPRLFPAEGAARWPALRRQALGDGLMEINVLRVTEQRRPREAQSEGHLAAFRLKTAAVLDLLEADGLDPAGAPDIGHITIGCALAHLDFRFAADAWRTGHPRLSAWYAAFAERPSMRDTEFVDVY
jgi:glutathione S-transferase